MPGNMTPEVPIFPSVQALKGLEFKSELPDIRMQLSGKKTTSEGEVGVGLLRLQQEQLARERLMGEREPVPYIELQTLGFLGGLEKAEGSRQEEGALEWPLTIQLQNLTSRKIGMQYPVDVLVGYGGAQKLTGEGFESGNWHVGVPASFGFESEPVSVGGRLREAVDLGDDTKRKELVNRIEKFTRQVFARMKFANLYGHLFKRSIESVNNLATMYLASVDITPEDVRALLTLPVCPEDCGKMLESAGGVKYEPQTALGKMMISAWQIFNATGLSEKPELFKEFISQEGWKNNVGAIMGTNVFEQWFGKPDEWKPGLVDRDSWNPDGWLPEIGNKSPGRTKEALAQERSTHSRGTLLEWGNIFVNEESSEYFRLYKKAVVSFLGGSATAEKAVELAWKNFRMFACADFVGYEWYVDEKQKVIHAAIPLGGNLSSDVGKLIRPDEYFEFYHKDTRGGLPRGAYGKVTPFAVDVLRGLGFGKNYVLSNGEVAKDRDGKPYAPSLHDLLFIYGIPPERINYDRLGERAIQSPFLRWFMAAKGDEYGKGSFDKTSSKIESPEPFLSPAFWEKLMSDFHVGIKAETVAWNKFVKNNGKDFFKLPDEPEVREYRLEAIRTIMDGIFADEASTHWDTKPIEKGLFKSTGGIAGVYEKTRGIVKRVKTASLVSHEIIKIANTAIPDLKYGDNRLVEVRKLFNIPVHED